MRDNIQKFLDEAKPSFVSQVLKGLDEMDLTQGYVRVETRGGSSVDLRDVVGFGHPDYRDCTWQQLAGTPFGDRQSAYLKRIHGNLAELASDPDYYRRRDRKDNWTFAEVGGVIYCVEGVHRTVIGRYVLESQRVEPIVHGVTLEIYARKADPRDQEIDPAETGKSWWQRILGL